MLDVYGLYTYSTLLLSGKGCTVLAVGGWGVLCWPWGVWGVLCWPWGGWGALCWPKGGWGALHANYVQFIYKVSTNVPNGQKQCFKFLTK